MKSIKIVTLFVLALCIHLSTFGQTTPTPPTPPETNSNSSYSYRSTGSKSSHSISISNDNDTYKLRARYNKKLTSKIRTFLMKKLTNKNYYKVGTSSHWKIEKNDESVFYCKLAKNSLKIYMDKESFSGSFQKEIIAMGKELRYLISGRNAVEENKRELERAERELKRAQKALKEAQDRLTDH